MMTKGDLLEARRIAAHAELFREGEAGDTAYIIESGRVEVSLMRDGSKVVIAELGPGSLLGEMALIGAGTRSATATALEETRVATIQRDQLEAALEDADPVIKLFLRVLLQRFHEANLKLHGGGDGGGSADAVATATYREDLDRAVENLHLRDELQRALEQNELVLYYQPIVELVSGHIAGYESLIRWQHPERGLVGPFEFIGFAEKSGQIDAIGDWVLQEACAAAVRLATVSGDSSRFVAFNVSTRQLDAEDFIDRTGVLLDASGVDPQRMKFEVTESLLVADPERASAQLAELKMLGVRLALDDFGTGYSSLSYLHRYPFDTLKIDRSFITTMLRNSDSMEIVRCILGMAQGLMLEVVAEGIESEDELSLLADLGCIYGQGYHFARPLPETEAFALLKR